MPVGTHMRDSALRHAEPPLLRHAQPVDRVVSELETAVDGLSDVEALARLTRHGANRLPAPPGVSAFTILTRQLRSVVVWLLAAAAGISLGLGDIVEAAAIAAVLVINAALGFITEWRARRAMEALLDLAAPQAAVLRNGHLAIVDAASLVPGDVIQVEAGNRVPADARVMHVVDLTTMEAALTGESLPVEKTADVLPDRRLAVADRANMVYLGTVVATGSGRAVVTATGPDTELGRIGALVGGIEEEQTPLERRLDALGRRVAWITIGIAGVVSGLGLAHGLPLGQVLETGIALAVAAMPEALPAVATIALAVGMRRMAHRHALVRRLPAVETLGSTTVVCTDKTRTLTSGDMTIVSVWTAGRHYSLSSEELPGPDEPAVRGVLETAVLSSKPQAHHDRDKGGPTRDPVDHAVQVALDRAGVSSATLLSGHPPRCVLPFSSGRKLMATFHERNGRLYASVKGAPERVIALADRVLMADGPRRLDEPGRANLQATNLTMARSGLRVLGVAAGYVEDTTESALGALTLEGFLGLADPPARGVKETIARLRRAGLRTVMITGDQRATAEAIGRALGVIDAGARTMDGAELDALSRDEIAASVAEVNAFSRVSPEHKLVIVRALQQRGEIVAMLGDGVNDAAALKQADVGVAMGLRGTDVAKESAAIVLQDDRFETVAAAVEEGRVIFDNIRKFVFYLFSCNVAEILVLLLASLAAWPIPLLPLQLLWLNMVTDTFPALALAVEPGDSSVMRRPPRNPDEAILSRPFLVSILVHGAGLTAATLGVFWWGLLKHPADASTLAFMTLALAQIFHLGNARSQDDVLAPARAFANPVAIGAVGFAMALQLATVFDPLARLLHVTPLSVTEWSVVVLSAGLPALGGQLFKRLRPTVSS
jgi:Ca2+-transporting ATPase